jgi:hypothetical protein
VPDSITVVDSDGPHFNLLKSVLQSTWHLNSHSDKAASQHDNTAIPVIPILLPGAQKAAAAALHMLEDCREPAAAVLSFFHSSSAPVVLLRSGLLTPP